jgi:hypothetical protein
MIARLAVVRDFDVAAQDNLRLAFAKRCFVSVHYPGYAAVGRVVYANVRKLNSFIGLLLSVNCLNFIQQTAVFTRTKNARVLEIVTSMDWVER